MSIRVNVSHCTSTRRSSVFQHEGPIRTKVFTGRTVGSGASLRHKYRTSSELNITGTHRVPFQKRMTLWLISFSFRAAVSGFENNMV